MSGLVADMLSHFDVWACSILPLPVAQWASQWMNRSVVLLDHIHTFSVHQHPIDNRREEPILAILA